MLNPHKSGKLWLNELVALTVWNTIDSDMSRHMALNMFVTLLLLYEENTTNIIHAIFQQDKIVRECHTKRLSNGNFLENSGHN
ncbi:hypothetical protein F8M41_008871 [Gigaspora margarita]|uniref:Uncharacterized protein n=1 Tax=Gigaspora margarita TaxID=4874 RepID=A0A8H3X4B6_GIGMA|nr:hypothetical protein F8M41_008871 [Gigaspora margarita]